MNGFIKLHRQLLDWEWYSDIKVSRVFLHLLLTANFKPKRWQGVEIKRGQLITSLENLAKGTNLSIQNVRTVLKKLEKTGELTNKSTNKNRLITLVNFDLYQDRTLETNKQTNKQLTGNQQTTNKQLTTTKERKKDKKEEKEKNIAESFDSFWNLYNYKKDKKKGLAAWKKLTEANRALALQGVPAYLKSLENTTISQAYPATWLNAERWNDEYENTAKPIDKTELNGELITESLPKNVRAEYLRKVQMQLRMKNKDEITETHKREFAFLSPNDYIIKFKGAYEPLYNKTMGLCHSAIIDSLNLK